MLRSSMKGQRTLEEKKEKLSLGSGSTQTDANFEKAWPVPAPQDAKKLTIRFLHKQR